MPSLNVYSDATKHMSLGNCTRKDHVQRELPDEALSLSDLLNSELPDSEAVTEGVGGRRRREEEARGTVGSGTTVPSSSAMNVLNRPSADSRKAPSD